MIARIVQLDVQPERLQIGLEHLPGLHRLVEILLTVQFDRALDLRPVGDRLFQKELGLVEIVLVADDILGIAP